MNSITTIMAAVAVFAAGGAAAQTTGIAPVSSPDATTFVQVGRLLADPGTGAVARDKTLVIRGNQVVEIRDGFDSGDGGDGRIVDLRDSFVLPGLIDSHVHLTSQQNPNARLEAVTLSSADRGFVGARHARRTLMAGFTTVADLGGSNESVFALRDAIRRGDVPGPRVIAPGSSVSIHGGHGDANGYRDDVMRLLSSESICSGVEGRLRRRWVPGLRSAAPGMTKAINGGPI